MAGVIDNFKDPAAAAQEIERAKKVYNEKKAAGDTAGADAASKWADQVRAVSGLDKDPNYGKDKTIAQVQTAINAAKTPAQTTGPKLTTTSVGGAINSINQGINPVTSKPLAQQNTTQEGLLDKAGQMVGDSQPIDYKQMFAEIMGMIPQTQAKTVLSWEEAMERAKSQLNPVYDERMDALNKNIDYNNIQSGFYGQLPGEALKRETQLKEEQGRAAAISGMANSLVGQSEQDALNVEQLNMQKQNQALSVIQSAIAQAANQKNSNLSNILAVINALGNKEQTDFNKAVTESNITGYYDPYADVAINPEVYKYASMPGGYQAKIDELEKTDPSNPLLPSLLAARSRAVINDPDLRAKYGDQYMTQAAKTQALENEMNTFKFNLEKKYLPAQYQAQYDQAQAEIARIKSVDPNIENEINRAKLAEIYASIAKTNSDAWNNTRETTSNINYKQGSLAIDQQKADAEKSKITPAKQDQIDNTAIAEAQAQFNAGKLKDWFEKNSTQLAKDLSTTVYNQIRQKVYGKDFKDDTASKWEVNY